jgi:hypothetical protein
MDSHTFIAYSTTIQILIDIRYGQAYQMIHGITHIHHMPDDTEALIGFTITDYTKRVN